MPFDLFALLGDVPIDPLVLLVEVVEAIDEFLGHVRGFAQDLSGQRLDLPDSARSTGLLLD